jgi:uncharacterized glyoxalase superfamily protein PhnB
MPRHPSANSHRDPVDSLPEGPAAIDFLCNAFGFERNLVVDGDGDTVVHAQLTLGSGMIMLGSEASDEDDPRRLRAETGPSWISVVLDEVDEHFERAKAAGAEIVLEPRDEEYGGRGYTVRDPEGNLWSFGTYRPTVDE